MGKLKNGKAEGKDEVTEEMIMSGGNIMVNLILRLFSMTFQSGSA